MKVSKIRANISGICPVLIATLSANLGSFVLGYSIGFPSPIQDHVKRIGLLDDTTFPIFSSSVFLAAILGSLLVLLSADLVGRKALIILFTLPSSLGWCMIASGYSGAIMLMGRALTGIAWGGISSLTSVYIADLAPKKFKGLYGSIFTHAFVGGIFVSNFLGIYLKFQWLALVPVSVNLLQGLLMFWQPDSPTWLISRSLDKKAMKTLKYLRGSEHDCLAEFNQIQKIVMEKQLTISERFCLLFTKVRYLKPLAVVCFCFVCNGFTGVSVITSYSAEILESSSLIPPKVASLVPTLMQSFSMLFCTILVDRVGRKPLLIISSVGIALCYAMLSGYHFSSLYIWPQCYSIGQNTSYNSNIQRLVMSEDFCSSITLLPMIALLTIRFMYGVGWGPLPWILLGETFPLKVRSAAASISVITRLLFSGVPILVFPYLKQLIGQEYVFLIFLFLNITSPFFVFIFVPETKGKSLEEVEDLFKKRIVFITCKYSCHKSENEIYIHTTVN
ncbi:hypothetical protein LOD99_13117 [Oopsacas minuta]|uniref:Major facilitator superfamily (MFS) profile domain-containing protein n=1 Tax=Oopsacas minuta TaxID=111878 RepID=A0AAV7JAW2_9METZ|nr:hypothetical protein LOD99_13117 [Oopsacas minuta]